jgi:hypothetical protein
MRFGAVILPLMASCQQNKNLYYLLLYYLPGSFSPEYFLPIGAIHAVAYKSLSGKIVILL